LYDLETIYAIIIQSHMYNFSSSIIKVKYALESINEAIDPLNEVKLERSRI